MKDEVYKEFILLKRYLSKQRKECREKHQQTKLKMWKNRYDSYNFAYQQVQGWMEKND